MSSIPISGLNELTTIASNDFFPIVDSGSLTTYRTTYNTVNNWMLASGSASSSLQTVSSSYSNTSSFSTTSITSSFASKAALADTASYFNLKLNVPAFATSSLSSSWATSSLTSISSSYASVAGSATSASLATLSKTSSYLQYSGFNNGTASHALSADTSTSSSYVPSTNFAVRSTTADTASYYSGSNSVAAYALLNLGTSPSLATAWKHSNVLGITRNSTGNYTVSVNFYPVNRLVFLQLFNLSGGSNVIATVVGQSYSGGIGYINFKTAAAAQGSLTDGGEGAFFMVL